MDIKVKPNILCSAFFVSIIIFSADSAANVRCTGEGFSNLLTRSEVLNIDSDSIDLGAVSGKVIINGSVNLDVSQDIVDVVNQNIQIEIDGPVWEVRVTGNPRNGLTGYVTADYEFISDFGDVGQLCSTPSSCIDIQVTQTFNIVDDRRGPNSTIGRRSEGIIANILLDEAEDTGPYTGFLSVYLKYGNRADGSDGTDFACDRITIN